VRQHLKPLEASGVGEAGVEGDEGVGFGRALGPGEGGGELEDVGGAQRVDADESGRSKARQPKRRGASAAINAPLSKRRYQSAVIKAPLSKRSYSYSPLPPSPTLPNPLTNTTAMRRMRMTPSAAAWPKS
jgi:hypothetical protein